MFESPSFESPSFESSNFESSNDAADAGETVVAGRRQRGAGPRIGELRDAVVGYVENFTGDLVTPADARAVVEAAARIESAAATLKSMAARRVAQSGSWRSGGDRSAEHWLARTTGSSVRAARHAIDTAERLESQPDLAAAARAGRISASQAEAISDAAAADPSAAPRLLQAAERRVALQRIRADCVRTKAASLGGDDVRHAAVRRQRHVRYREHADGGAELSWYSVSEEVAEVKAAIDALAQGIFREHRDRRAHEPPDAYRSDALLQLVRQGAGGAGASKAVDAKVIVRVDQRALERGRTVTGETCEIAGLGPVSVAAVRERIAAGDVFLAALATVGEDVHSVAHLGRRPRSVQRTALEWLGLDRCTNERCTNTIDLEIDHGEMPWAEFRRTVTADLDGLCASNCHFLKTHRGWSLVRGTGPRTFVAPDDPRHPSNAPLDTS